MVKVANACSSSRIRKRFLGTFQLPSLFHRNRNEAPKGGNVLQTVVPNVTPTKYSYIIDDSDKVWDCDVADYDEISSVSSSEPSTSSSSSERSTVSQPSSISESPSSSSSWPGSKSPETIYTFQDTSVSVALNDELNSTARPSTITEGSNTSTTTRWRKPNASMDRSSLASSASVSVPQANGCDSKRYKILSHIMAGTRKTSRKSFSDSPSRPASRSESKSETTRLKAINEHDLHPIMNSQNMKNALSVAIEKNSWETMSTASRTSNKTSLSTSSHTSSARRKRSYDSPSDVYGNDDSHYSVSSDDESTTTSSVDTTMSKKTWTTTTSTTTATTIDDADISSPYTKNSCHKRCRPSPSIFESVLDHPFPLWYQLDRLFASLTIPPHSHKWDRSQRGQIIHHLIHFLELKSFVTMISSSSCEELIVAPSSLIDIAWHALAFESHLYQQVIQIITTFHNHQHPRCHRHACKQEEPFMVPYEFSPCKYTKDDYDSIVWEEHFCRTQNLYKSLFKEFMPLTLDNPTNDGRIEPQEAVLVPFQNSMTVLHQQNEQQPEPHLIEESDDVSSVVSWDSCSSERLFGLDLL